MRRAAIEHAIDLCLAARDCLDVFASAQTRLLLDLLLLDLGRELALLPDGDPS